MFPFAVFVIVGKTLFNEFHGSFSRHFYVISTSFLRQIPVKSIKVFLFHNFHRFDVIFTMKFATFFALFVTFRHFSSF